MGRFGGGPAGRTCAADERRRCESAEGWVQMPRDLLMSKIVRQVGDGHANRVNDVGWILVVPPIRAP